MGERKGAAPGEGKGGDDECEEHHVYLLDLEYACVAETNYESRRKSSAGGGAVLQSSWSCVLSMHEMTYWLSLFVLSKLL